MNVSVTLKRESYTINMEKKVFLDRDNLKDSEISLICSEAWAAVDTEVVIKPKR
jgi:hypothetical protein